MTLDEFDDGDVGSDRFKLWWGSWLELRQTESRPHILFQTWQLQFVLDGYYMSCRRHDKFLFFLAIYESGVNTWL